MTELMPSLCNDCVARNQCGNDDVKMCISYTKEAKIRCDDCKFVENCVDYGWKDCKKFTPKQSESMTNEEWLRQANTEQTAEWMASVVKKAISIKENNGIVMLESAIWWDEWLKQPHTPKE